MNLFREPVGAPMPPDAINALVAAASRRAGLARRVTPHQLRHAMASNLADSGAAIDEIAELIGHSSVSSTQIYVHPDPRRLRAAVERVVRPAILPGGAGDPRAGRCMGARRRIPVSRGSADGGVAVFERLIDPAFLAEGGLGPGSGCWPRRQSIRCWGARSAARRGARHRVRPGPGLPAVPARLARAGLGLEAVSELPEPPCQPPSRCAVEGCPRSWKTSGDRLCLTHLRQQREVLKVPLEVFLADPQTRPLPPCGPCQVPACRRDRDGTSGSYCDAHQQRFRAAARAVPGWMRRHGGPPAGHRPVRSGQLVRSGAAGDRPAASCLAAAHPQEAPDQREGPAAGRARSSACTMSPRSSRPPPSTRRSGLDRNARTLLPSLARHAHRALLNPETEKVKDVWDLAAFGHPAAASLSRHLPEVAAGSRETVGG